MGENIPMLQRNRETVLLSGWLFSDLLLGLMMIFLVSVQPPPPPGLLVNEPSLNPKSQNCTKEIGNYSCTLTLKTTSQSLGEVNWKVDTTIGSKVIFSPTHGVLLAGKSVQVTIRSIPCSGGAFTFSGQARVSPVIVTWSCTRPPLSLQPEQFGLTVADVPGLLAGSTAAVEDIQNQVSERPELQGQQVGLVILYDGAPDASQNSIDQAQNVDHAVDNALSNMAQNGFTPLQGAKYYDEFQGQDALFTLGGSPKNVKMQVFLFQE